MSSRTRSASFSAPSSSSMKDHGERRAHRGKRAKEIVCETCGKVYKHPVCLQKHRWEHNPLWRDTAQLLLSKHQQVQVMEAAAILVHGASLPSDRALWPSYTSGGKLPEPRLAADGTVRERRAVSPAPTVSSSARDELPPDDEDDLEEISEEERDDENENEEGEEEDEPVQEEEDDTEESDAPVQLAVSTPNQVTRGRSQSLAAPVSSHMPNLYGSYGLGSRYNWGVIGESGQVHNMVNKSPISDAHASILKSPRSPMAIPNGDTVQLGSPLTAHPSHHGHHTSISSFGSIASSASSFIPFGSASTSSYIPSSSVRSGDWRGGEDATDEADDMDMEDDTFTYGSRASSLYKRLAAVTGNNPSGFMSGAATPSKSVSRERRSHETMYEMEMD